MQHTLKRLAFSLSIITSCLALGLVPARAADSPGAGTPVTGEGSVPQLETAAEQLKHAGSIKQSMRGLVDEERSAVRSRAVAAYQAVLDFFPGESATCAEAAFRAGELMRAGGAIDGALASFTNARQRGGGTVFKARSGLEIGHIHRRGDDSKAALDAYGGVMEDVNALPGYRDEGRLWAGRVWHDNKGRAQALRLWEQVAQHGEDHMDRIRAFDYLALDLIEGQDLEGAAGMLERCREALASVSEEETRLGERLRKSLTRMRAVRALQKAVEQREQDAREALNEEQSSEDQ